MSNLSNTVSHPPPLPFSIPVKIQTVKQNKTKRKTAMVSAREFKASERKTIPST